MDKLKKAINGMECCKYVIGEKQCSECPYERVGNVNCFFNLASDTLELLTEKKPKKGYWQPYKYGDDTWHQCSACGVADRYIDIVKREGYQDYRMVSKRNFCPNCGADMRGDKE